MRRDRSGTYVTMLRNAHAAGIKAFRAGKTIKENPYKRMETRDCWVLGWREAEMKGKIRDGVS